MDSKKKILVIEDELIIRLGIITLLNATGMYEIREAPNGETGIEIAEDFLPDLIISDVNMPGTDGYGVLEAIRNNRALSDTPFIFLTALASKQELRYGMDLGADDYLTKPFAKDELYRAITSRLEKHSQQKRVAQQKMDELRNNLSVSLPHELLTPLIGMIGCADILEQDSDSLTADDLKEFGRTIRHSSRKLQSVIENFLTLARLEILISNASNLSELRNSITEHTTSLIKDEIEKQLFGGSRQNDVHLVECNSTVAINNQHFNKLINEILSNAIKFSPEGSPIKIEESVTDKTWNLTITDFGRGMTDEQINNIGAYMQFGRHEHEQQGTGLGLAICKRIATLYHGNLTVKSTPVQQTAVTISLPLVKIKKQTEQPQYTMA